MIDRAEIRTVATELSLTPEVVEKDYVLGWLLSGIYNHEMLAHTWVFKGGTCLKKCYFETYRFSEDLDFTLTDAAHLDAEFLGRAFDDVSKWIYEQSGIEIPANQLRFEVYENRRTGRSCEGRIYYSGPLQRAGSLARIKLDLTTDEVLVLEPVRRPVGHPYSDLPVGGIHALCYPFEELFAEKVRALAERTRPRDLYDVINLFRHGEFRPAVAILLDILRRKCAFKGIAVPTFGALTGARDELTADWAAMLGHQLPALPPFESFWDALPEFFSWLEGGLVATIAPAPLAEGDVVLRPPVGLLRMQGVGGSSHLERIRFAGSNRLCIELDYVDEQGRRSARTIEPYSLRRTRAGDIVLMAVRADSGNTRSYRLDRIQGAQVSQRTFVPRHEVELSAAEIGAIPPLSRGGSSSSLIEATPRPARRVRSSGGRGSGGLVYTYECPFCRKRFSRSKQDPQLRPHKAPNGWDCSGRTGYLVDTRWQ